MNDYPAMIAPVNHVEPVPRRIRAFLGGEKVLDTTRALYVWEWPYYPQYYIPVADVRGDLLIPEGHTQQSRRGRSEAHALRAGRVQRPGAARLLTDSPVPGLAGTVRFDWAALDAWFEEDEQVFVHPRSPYVRVDALRSARPVRVELDGVVLAESASPVMVFETGLPTRYYINPTEVSFGHLIPSGTVTSCPYKGTPAGTGRSASATRRTPIWHGPTTSRPASSSPSQDWWPSTTKRSTCSSAASGSSGPRRTSSRRPAAPAPHQRGRGPLPLAPALPALVTVPFAMPLTRYRSDRQPPNEPMRRLDHASNHTAPRPGSERPFRPPRR